MFFGMLALMAEFESDLIRSRTVEGMREAAKRGRLLGKPSRLSVLQRKRLLADYESGEYSAAQLMDISGLSRSVMYATLNKAREELNRPRFLAALLLAAPGGASDEVSPSGGCWSGACAELFKGDQAVAVRARAAGAEAGGEGVAVRAALLTEVAGVAVRAGVDGAGAPGSRWGWCSGRGGHWDGVAAPVGGLPAGLVAVCLPSPGGGQGCLAGQALSR